MLMKDVIIIGTGGHAKVVADIIERTGDNLIGFLTSDRDKTTFIGKPVLGCEKDYINYKTCCFIVAIGNTAARERISQSMTGINWYTAIHPNSIISSMDTSFGEGTTVMANAVINPCARIGNHCIINTGAVVEHDNVIEDYTHISVGAKLAGSVHIGKRTWVGVAAAVNNGIRVCDDCMIGSGAVVVKDIAEPGTYIGVPARKIK